MGKKLLVLFPMTKNILIGAVAGSLVKKINKDGDAGQKKKYFGSYVAKMS